MLIKNLNYTDIPFFISKNGFTNDLNLIKNLSAIRQSIKNIIMTNTGERSFDHKFGCDIYNYLFENFTIDMVVRAQSTIAGNIQRYEGFRVGINDIKIINVPAENKIDIIVDYNIPDAGISDIISVSILRTR
jgi:phage baseplate assembly protein W